MTEELQDSLTGAWSRFGLLFFAEHYLKLLRRVKREMTMFVVGVDGLPANGTDGTWMPAQEASLKETARLLRRTFRTSDAVARIGPDLFAVLLLETSDLGADILLTRLEDRLAEWKTEHPDQPPLTLSLVVDRVRADQEMAFVDALSRITAALRRRQANAADRGGASPETRGWTTDFILPAG
ncbi:MAG: diguanylate cyclase [Nitrospira sp.]|nr:diguanylate cyclase [Nitrospira sp.]